MVNVNKACSNLSIHLFKVVSIFPNPASCLRLVSAVLNEISEEWLTGRTYIRFEGHAPSPPQGSKYSFFFFQRMLLTLNLQKIPCTIFVLAT